MPLPNMKSKHPLKTVTIPSSKKKIKVRPFTVKEEKILLLANVSEEVSDQSDAIKQIIANCVVDDLDVDTLATFDIEYLFIQLRAFSVNNIIELQYKDQDDGVVYDLELDLNNVEVYFSPDHIKTIELVDGVGVVMRYPDLEMLEEIRQHIVTLGENPEQGEAMNALTMVYAKCVDKVWEDDAVYTSGDDFTEEEVISFLDDLLEAEFGKIQQFFETMPVLSHEVFYMNMKGERKSITLRGLRDFFP